MTEKNEQEDKTGTDTGKGQEQEAKFTQADIDRFIKERLEREGIKELREKARKLDELQKSQLSAEDAAKATVTDLQQKLVVSEAGRAKLELEHLKDELLDKAGLPRAWAKRIIGTSEQEILADIDILRRQLTEGGAPNVGNAGNPADKAKATNKPTLSELLQRAIK